MRGRLLTFALAMSCTARGGAAAPAAPPAAASAGPATVQWVDVRSEIEELICIAKFDVPGHGEIESAVYGDRETCKLPKASTPLERAVAATYADAQPALMALRGSAPAVQAAMKLADPEARIAAVRAAYLEDRFVGVLLRRLGSRLAAEGLECSDCPPPSSPPPRTVEWSTLAPYVAAYVWPDPVVTPRGPDGKPNGKPTYSLHICVGLNGVAELKAPDPDLLVAAFVATMHTAELHEQAAARFSGLLESPDFAKLTTDDARTQFLRDRLGSGLAADPTLLPAICETLARFRDDTGLTVRECTAPG